MAEEVNMAEVCNEVIASFQSPRFTEQIETFVNCNIEVFSHVCTDGSHPLSWTHEFKKYKNMYEVQMENTIATSGAEATTFMKYMEDCNAHYGETENFKQLLEILTASQDYNNFLQRMFAAVRDNWVPESGESPAQAEVQVHPVDIVIPEQYAPGMVMHVEYLGLQHPVTIPEGCAPGMTIRAELQVPVS
eukprot:TRINITY_DN53054_c0_g1_i1.p1 TRINITY_DN53054_c0_g1~~TRINITY_DN53054_c0_g1_i1.p1  ORF type:complete len:190 (-),score=36.86 TRINITY_DN53054_c0_g1_i1:81-650(-)